MKLQDIGFYTLSDNRAKNVSKHSPLWRCEMILTDACNFKCPYCKGIRSEFSGALAFDKALYVLSVWCDNNLKNLRFSGGEPLMYKGLVKLVSYAKDREVERIAISTNGSFPLNKYKELINAGVNDISISLDACCSAFGDEMSGITGSFGKVIENIAELSKLTYVTVGVVVTDKTIHTAADVIRFAHSLGVSDIRLITAAQNDGMIPALESISEETDLHPILKYRLNNLRAGRNVRGLSYKDSNICYLGLDDMVCLGGKHFPCIIHMREGGDPIGDIGDDIREQRLEWVKRHDSWKDPICKKNCLDVCVDYNNKVSELNPISLYR